MKYPEYRQCPKCRGDELEMQWCSVCNKTGLVALLQSAPQAPAVPEEWREVLRECADDLSIELDQRYGDSRKYPSEQRKYEAEMQPVYHARSLLQSVGEKK